MVDLAEAANLAIVLGFVATIAAVLYGPWAKRRELMRPIITKLAQELRDTKIAARDPAMDRYIPVPGTWIEHGALFPKRIGREVGNFCELCRSYQEKSKEASNAVKLAVYEGMARSRLKGARPASDGKGESTWIVLGPRRSRTSRPILEEAFIDILEEPLLRRAKVRWSNLVDSEPELTEELMKAGIKPVDVNSMIEGIEKALSYEAAMFDRLQDLKARIRDYPFRHFAKAN